jgi:hypothetical protein
VSRPLSQLLDGTAPAPTREQLRAALDALLALSEAIRALGSVPSGVLYAHVMGVMSIDAYASAVATMKGAGLVVEEANVLRWTGPTFDAEGKRVP